jgi:hypothetical protein
MLLRNVGMYHIPHLRVCMLTMGIGDLFFTNAFKCFSDAPICQTLIVTRGLRVLREQLFLRLLLTTCRASKYTLDLESCLGTLRQS